MARPTSSSLDRHGAVLAEQTVEVKGPSDPTVVVYRGPTRQTYSCTPDCSPRITLGDTGKDDFDKETQLYNDYFNQTLGQAAGRNTPGREPPAPWLRDTEAAPTHRRVTESAAPSST